VNTYRTEFFARCQASGMRIKYGLTIRSAKPIMVEPLVALVQEIREGRHEEIADMLAAVFSGEHTLTADHHSVTIETVRGKLE
jgi:hypothetical protein